jgi:uncharacterized protein (TIGR02246 family)
MRTLAAVLAAILGVLPGAAQADAAEAQVCSRGDDARIIQVLTPGVVGRACDLKVTRDAGAYVSTPYHANNSPEFCSKRSAEMIAALVADGFDCAPAPQTQESAALEAPAPGSDVGPTSEEISQPAEADPPALEAAASAPEAEPAAPEETLEGQYAALTEPATAPAPEAAANVPLTSEKAAEGPVAMLEQPISAPPAPQAANPEEVAPSTPRLASAGPVALAPTQASALAGVAPSRPARGRIVGAAPDERPLDAAPGSDVAEERLAARPAGPPAAASPADAAPAVTATTAAGVQPRAAHDVIKSVLAAQAAAWNEGDLDAFMGVYWKDQGLRLVSGSTVADGWKEAFRFFRERYADSETMGRLTFEKLDVDLVTPDVATVYGRYRRDAGSVADAGAFTLVMKRLDGLWRIVSDHTVPDRSSAN